MTARVWAASAAAGVVLGAVAFAAPAAASAPAAAPASGLGYSGASCSGPLGSGKALVTRQTGPMPGGGYWTSIHLSSTGNEFKLVWDRGYGWGTKRGLVKLARGASGTVDAPRSWGFKSRTGNITVSVGYVDTVTARPGQVNC